MMSQQACHNQPSKLRSPSNNGLSDARFGNEIVWNWPAATLAAIWDLSGLTVLLAVVAVVPLIQLVSLGYLLRAAANLSSGQPWRTALPGVRLAGRLVTFAMLTALLWLPVLLVTDLSYSVQLLRPGTAQAAAWRVAAFIVASVWLMWVAWAAMRGGRWWHVLWPQPLRFIKEFGDHRPGPRLRMICGPCLSERGALNFGG